MCLNDKKIKTYGLVLLMTYAVNFCMLSLSDDYRERKRTLLFGDYICYYATSKILHASQNCSESACYNIDELNHVASEVLHRDTANRAVMLYPPLYFFFIYGLGLFSYAFSFALFILLPALSCLLLARAIVPDVRNLVLVFCSFTGCYQCLIQGQNGFWVAFLLTASLFLLEKNPLASGIVLGLAAFKPQFSVFLFLIYLLDNRHKALLTAVGTVVLLVALSVAAFGVEPWLVYGNVASSAQKALSGQFLPLAKMTTLFSSLLLVQAGRPLATALQAVLSLTSLAIVVYCWRKKVDANLKYAITLIAILTFTHYAYDYDWIVAMFSLLFFVKYKNKASEPTTKWESVAMLAIFTGPLIGTAVSNFTNVQLLPVALCFYLYFLLRAAGTSLVVRDAG